MTNADLLKRAEVVARITHEDYGRQVAFQIGAQWAVEMLEAKNTFDVKMIARQKEVIRWCLDELESMYRDHTGVPLWETPLGTKLLEAGFGRNM